MWRKFDSNGVDRLSLSVPIYAAGRKYWRIFDQARDVGPLEHNRYVITDRRCKVRRI
jgi:hypothetical protein